MSATVSVAVHEGDQLGEGPLWHDDALLRVDITAGRVLTWRPGDAASHVQAFPAPLGAAAPRAGGGLLLAIGRELVAADPDGTRTVLAAVAPDDPDQRFNDCRCDPQGRLWAGTMSMDKRPGRSALHRLVPGEPLATVVPGVTLSNGIGWSPEGDRMYYIDTPTRRIDVFAFDGATGALADRRTLAAADDVDGSPDGLAVDAEGGVWVCFYGGGQVRRYAPDGTPDAAVALPTANPTCPAFGGAGLRTLYVTTARRGLTPAQLAAQPLAGAVLQLDPGVAGLPANAFAG